MAEIEGIEKLLSFAPKKIFGRFRFYGMAQYGWSHYGESEIYIITKKTPPIEYLCDHNGVPLDFSGIYRTDNVSGYTRYYREPYYITKNPRYAPQQAWRGIFADAIAGWQALTAPEKEVYNQRAKYKHYSGYNLFIKEYLLSH